MRGRGIGGLLAVCAAAACSATVGGAVDPVDGGDDQLIDAAEPIDAEVLGAWGPPARVGAASSQTANEDDGTLSYSGLELVFAIIDPADGNRKHLFYASRPDLQSDFGTASRMPFSATGITEETPRFSADDLTLFFARSTAANGLDIHSVTRATAGSTTWSTPQPVAGVNSAGTDKWFAPCGPSRFLMIAGNNIAEGTVGGGAPVVVPELSSTSSETGTFVTQDCLTVYFASNRPDGMTNRIYTASRPAVGMTWSDPVVVQDFAILGGDQQDPFVATNDRTFLFVSNVDGSNDLYLATR